MARRKGEAGDHKGPPRVRPATLAPTDTEACGEKGEAGEKEGDGGRP